MNDPVCGTWGCGRSLGWGATDGDLCPFCQQARMLVIACVVSVPVACFLGWLSVVLS